MNVSLATGFALLQLRTRHSWKVHYEIVILMMSLFCVCLKSYKDKTSDNIIPSENSLKEFLSSTHTSKRMNLSLPKGLVLPSNIIFVPRVVSDSQSLTASSKFSNCTFFSVSKQKIFANLQLKPGHQQFSATGLWGWWSFCANPFTSVFCIVLIFKPYSLQ